MTSFGVTSLTENNYANILKSLIAKSSDGLTRLSLESAKEQLDALKHIEMESRLIQMVLKKHQMEVVS